MSDSNGNAPRSFDELEAETTFTEVIDGFHFRMVEPSLTQMAARGVLPPGLLLPGPEGAAAGTNDVRAHLLFDEKMQDALLEKSLIAPRVWAGDETACPDGRRPICLLGRFRDRLIVALLSRLFGSEAVRGAAFRGEERTGGQDSPAGEAVGANAVGGPGAPD